MGALSGPGQAGRVSPTAPDRSRVSRGSHHPGHRAPPWGRCWAEARPGCGSVGGGPCLGQWCPPWLQSWLWYRGSCSAGGGRGAEGQVKAGPVGRGSPHGGVWSLSRGIRRKGQPSCAASMLTLSTGGQASRRGMMSGALTEAFLFGNKEQRQHIHGCCTSRFSAP